MKMAMAALAVVLVAQAAPAMAQEQGERGNRGDRQERLERRDQAQPDRMGSGRPDWAGRGVRAPGPSEAPRAQPAPQAQQAPQPDRPRFRGDGRPTQPGGQDLSDRRGDDRRGDGQRGGGQRGDGQRGYGARGDGQRGDGQRGDGRRDDGRRDWNGRGGDDRRDWDRRDNDRRDNGRDWDRRGDDRRDWDRRGDRQRWERGRYPPAYFSSNRYRYAWRPPSGFYLRSWSFGEFFPRGWYGPGYWIVDPWQYDLPLPPPGYDWVRSGPDAVLIDQFSGRIVQVVRNVFWY